MVKVSVVIPVYGVENYIERCARSLFEQTLDNIEYIFVNDCTKDNSIVVLESVLKEYPTRVMQTKIINCEKNGGQAVARKIGMKRATGEYIIQCDSDDWIDKTMYEKLYNKAKEADADVVSCNQYNVYSKKTTIQTNIYRGTPHEWLRNYKGSWGACTKMVRLSIISENGIYPFEGLNFSEDRCMMMRTFYYANKIELVEEPLYYYDHTREGSITNKWVTSVDVLHQREKVIDKMESWFADHNFDMGVGLMKWRLQMAEMYLFMKSPSWQDWQRLLPAIKDYATGNTFSRVRRYVYKKACKGNILPAKIYYSLVRAKKKFIQ